MKSKSPFTLLLTFLLALILAVSVYLYLNGLGQKKTEAQTFPLLTAKVEIPPNVKINAEMLESIQVSQLPADSNSYYVQPDEVVGKYTSQTILMGEPFYKSRILATADGNISLNLSNGNRAVSVTANLESGVSKLLKPGDHIDIIVSLPEIKDMQKVIRPDISKLIMQNIKVLAIDQETNPASDTDTAKKEAGSSAPTETVFYLTLSIPLEEVEKLTLAETIGRLKFALRPKDDNTIVPTDGAIWQEMLARVASTAASTSSPSNGSSPSTKASTPSETKKPSAPTVTYTYYTVKAGDTLMNIARTQLGDASKYKLLQQINNISDPNAIRPGTRIKLPLKK